MIIWIWKWRTHVNAYKFILNMHTYFKLIIAGRDYCEILCPDWVLFKWLSVAPKFCWCDTAFFLLQWIFGGCRYIDVVDTICIVYGIRTYSTYKYMYFKSKKATLYLWENWKCERTFWIKTQYKHIFYAFNKSRWRLYRYNLWYLDLYN